MRLILLTFLIHIGFMLNAQTSRALFIDSLYQQALNHIDSSWSITKNEEGIQLKLIDSFVVFSEVEIIDSIDCYLNYQGIEYHSWLTNENENLNLELKRLQSLLKK